GIVVTLSPGTSISGRVRVDGTSGIAGAFPHPEQKPGIELNPRVNGISPPTPGVPSPPYAPIRSDGRFQLENVTPGEFHIELSWLQDTYYIKQASLGAVDVLNSPFQLTGREPGDLEIVVSPNVASISGTVNNSRMTPAVGAQVVLIPENVHHRPELYKT